MDYSSFIKDALTQAAAIAKANFGKVSGATKSADNNQVLTATDLEIGKLLVEKIQNTFPGDNIIDEEAGIIDKRGPNTWVVDPIDGTSNFASGIPTFGIYLGLLQNATPIAGGLSLPIFDQIFVAEKGKGTWCNGQQVHVATETNLLSALVAYQIDSHQEDPEVTYAEGELIADIVLSCRNLRTSNSAFDAAMVIQGKYGALLNLTSKIWDNVAQQILIEEAGGVYTNFHGQLIDYSNPLTKSHNNFTYCAGAPELHKKLQEIIHQESITQEDPNQENSNGSSAL